MKWMKYRVKIAAAAEDLVTAALYDAGIEGVEIEDKAPLGSEELGEMFSDNLPDGKDDDGTAWLNFYLDPDDAESGEKAAAAKAAVNELKDTFDIGEGTIEESETEDIDWVQNWKQYFHSFAVDDILILPVWEPLPEDAGPGLVIRIDPGAAFGTGMHETTRLCIRQLKKFVTVGCRMLDIGTGSGILAIVAAGLGAGEILGTDLDPCSETSVAENKKCNRIPDSVFRLVIGNLINDSALREQVGTGIYDIVTANILPDVLVPMTPFAAAALKQGGVFITSGVLEDQAWKVRDAIRDAGLLILEETQDGGWISITARKP